MMTRMTFLGFSIKTILLAGTRNRCRRPPRAANVRHSPQKPPPPPVSAPTRPRFTTCFWYFYDPRTVWHIFGIKQGTNILFIMKSIVGLALLTFSLVLVSFRPLSLYTFDGITTAYTLDDITTAIRVGNAGELSRYLDNRVDISLPDKSDTYSKIQAEIIIRDFFTTNGVQNFLIKHSNRTGGGSEFCVGVLQTRNGDYRTTLFIKQKGDKQVLQELRFQTQ